MKKEELIARIMKSVPDGAEVMILDGFNGGGSPREINLGPLPRLITSEDGDDSCDCEDLVGEQVYVIGYGSY